MKKIYLLMILIICIFMYSDQSPDSVTSATHYNEPSEESGSQPKDQIVELNTREEHKSITRIEKPVPKKVKPTRKAADATTGSTEYISLKPAKETEARAPVLEQEDNMVELLDEFEDFGMINGKKESRLIIFNPSRENQIPPSKRFDYREESVNDLKTDYHLPGFIPRTRKEFFKAMPRYQYDNNGIIRMGKQQIDGELGKELFNQAYELFKTQEINSAASIFSRLIHYHYQISYSYYFLCLCYLQNKNHSLALHSINLALKYLDNREQTQFIKAKYLEIKGNLYYKLEDFNLALDYYQQSLAIKEEKSIYNKLGLIHYSIGHFQNALQFWEKGKKAGDFDSKENFHWLSNQLNR